MEIKNKVEYIDIKKLNLLENNPRQINKENFEKLKKSIKDNPEYFEARPLIISDRTGENVILAGNQRYKASQELGLKEVPCVILHNLTEEKEKEIIIRDNVELGDWDYDLLANNFDIEDLEEWGIKLDFFDSNELKTCDDIEEKEDEYSIEVENNRNIKVGDLFLLGKHKLICGDSTKKEDIDKLMGGVKADMVFTDPPYNINVSVHKKTDKTSLKILNDNLENDEFLEFLDIVFKNMKNHSKEKIHNYICCNMKCYSNFEKIINKNFKKKVSDIFIWKKDLPGLGFGYREQYEIIIFTGDMDSVVFEDKCESNVWEYAKSSSMAFRSQEKDNIDKSTSLLHPTIKPSFMIMRALKNSSKKDDIVLDLFGGSGSTLIACERCGRIGYLCELDPIFCNVIINRWEKLTGQKAIKIN